MSRPLIDIKINFKLPLLIGMVHLKALPGTPFNTLEIDEIAKIAIEESQMYQSAGFSGIIIENMHDRPYLKSDTGHEITASMAVIASRVKKALGRDFPVGIQILAGANLQALAVASAAKLDFIRAEGCLFSHIADEGLFDSDAGILFRERTRLKAERIRIWTDIQKKHSSHSITSDLTTEDWVHAAEFFGLDGVIITGSATGKAPDPKQLKAAKASTRTPVILGSGLNPENAPDYTCADAWIVGSSMKYDGYWENPISPERLKAMTSVWNELSR